MTRALLAVVPLLTALFVGLMVLLVGQPTRVNPELVDLLTAAACESPCWAGIIPGRTLTGEALVILEGHPWVEDVASYLYPDAVLGSIYWSWNGGQPDWIDSAQNGVLTIRDDRVERVSFRTRVAFGTVLLLLDNPQYGTLLARGQPNTYYHYAAYEGGQLELRSLPTCPMHRYNLWQTAVDLTLRAGTARYTQPYDLARWAESPVC